MHEYGILHECTTVNSSDTVPLSATTYSYTGPESLGSVVGHNCAALGLFSEIKSGDIIIKGKEIEGCYILQVRIGTNEAVEFTWEATADSEGRSAIGRALLRALRTELQIEASAWGDLVGVRPMKFYHKQWERLGREEATAQFLTTERQVGADKIQLMQKIARIQKPYLESVKVQPHRFSLYAGIPFCTTHCSYCSFPFGLIHEQSDRSAFIQTFVEDCRHVQSLTEQYHLTPDTAYMGGGTPTSLNEEEFSLVLKAFTSLVPQGRECTIEAGRPDTVTRAKLKAMLDAEKVNRISINPQSMQDDILRLIGRGHTAADIEALYKLVRRMTDFSVNMDFIAGLPRQTERDMQANMDYVCQQMPENVTIHTLALKKGSPLYTSTQRKELPEAQVVKSMTEYCAKRLEEAGYKPYYLYRQQYMTGHLENIGYTLPGKECVYNIQMMEERQPVIAIGPGTTSKWMRAPVFRQTKLYLPKDIETYTNSFSALAEKRAMRCAGFYGKG